MKKVLVYSDSLFSGLNIPTSAIQVESFPGVTAEEAVSWLKDEDPRSLKSVLAEDTYDCLIICFGTNDVGHGESAEKAWSNVLSLVKEGSDVKQIFITFLNENVSNGAKEFNTLAKMNKNIKVLDFFQEISDDLLSDGLHLNENGKNQLINVMLELL